MQPIIKAGFILGLGLGGFIDGIVTHQILGWHHLVCLTETCQTGTVEALRTQVRQDGFFHLATWCLTLAGIALLFRSRHHPTAWAGRKLTGGMLGGWGFFNFAEGLIDHQILGIHHVRPGHPYQLLFDLLFLASGLLLIGMGGVFARRR